MNRRLPDHALSTARGILAGNALIAWHSAMVDPGSRLFKVAQSVDGAYLLWGMALFAVAILVDAILNDWTPNVIRFGRLTSNLHWARGFNGRHWLLVGLAACYGAQPVAALLTGNKMESLPYFTWYPVTILIVAFQDAKQRSRESECLKTAS